MKKIIRLTESDLHNIIKNSVLKLLQEGNENNTLLQTIAQCIEENGEINVVPDENELHVHMKDDIYIYVLFDVLCYPYMKQGMRSSSYDVPDDPDELIDSPEVEIKEITLYNEDGDFKGIQDNGLIKNTLQGLINVNYDNYDVPSEEDFFETDY